MNQKSFRDYHLIEILVGYDEQTLPLDLYLSRYFRLHTAIGSKDRGYIVEALYALIRWKGLIDHFVKGEVDWEERFKVYQGLDLKAIIHDTSIPLHTRVSFPQSLFDAIANTHGIDSAFNLCHICNFPAPTTVRVNLLKTTRESLLARWSKLYSVSACQYSASGVVFHKKINFYALQEFKQGLFEIQDEGSQLLARLIKAAPGDQVLDYCAGAGGKTLAFAPAMCNQGQIFLHDIRAHSLIAAKKRLRRAGIQNSQIVQAEDPKLAKLKKRMDWVLADVPCSGTGTLRRNPDMKWKFEEGMVQRLVGVQKQIFEKALSYVKPGGKIVYATCSLLKEENQEQVQHFTSIYDLEVVDDLFQSLPSHDGMDGFFAAVFRRK